MPFLAKNRKDLSRKLVIDFGSGYLNTSILQLADKNTVRVSDHLADQTISSKKFFEACFRSIKKKVNQNSSKDKIINSQIRNNLYRCMNANRPNEPQYSSDKKIREHWKLNTNGVEFDLNMTNLGAHKLAQSVIHRFKSTFLINRESNLVEDEIRDILVCSDDILFEYLEPLLYEYLGPKTNIVFMDLDCACLGGAFLASTDIAVSDLLTFPISMSMYNGVVKPLIEAKRNFPCVGKYLFQTIVDNQQMVRVNLYEGHNPLARNNKHICEIKIDNSRKCAYNFERNKIELFVVLDVNGLLDVYAEETETRERLELTIDFDAVSYLEFERDPDERPVNINRKMSKKLLANEADLSKFLDDLDYYLEYLIIVYKHSPDILRQFIQSNVLKAKKYLSKNRLRITMSECDQLACELEELVQNNRPLDENMKQMQMLAYNDRMARQGSGTCNIL